MIPISCTTDICYGMFPCHILKQYEPMQRGVCLHGMVKSDRIIGIKHSRNW